LPVYEYQCTCCPSRFEIKRSFSDDNSPVFCPQCGGSAERVFSPVPIIFKGSGFYTTDNRGNHGHPSSEGDTGEAKASNLEENG